MTDFTKSFFEGQEKASSVDNQVKDIRLVIGDLIKSVSSATDCKIIVKLGSMDFHTHKHAIYVSACGSRGNCMVNQQKHNIAFIRFDKGYPCEFQLNQTRSPNICNNRAELTVELASMLRGSEIAGLLNGLLAEFKDEIYSSETKHCGVQS